MYVCMHVCMYVCMYSICVFICSTELMNKNSLYITFTSYGGEMHTQNLCMYKAQAPLRLFLKQVLTEFFCFVLSNAPTFVVIDVEYHHSRLMVQLMTTIFSGATNDYILFHDMNCFVGGHGTGTALRYHALLQFITYGLLIHLCCYRKKME